MEESDEDMSFGDFYEEFVLYCGRHSENRAKTPISELLDSKVIKCRWKGCDFLCSANLKHLQFQELESHLIGHGRSVQIEQFYNNVSSIYFECGWEGCSFGAEARDDQDDKYLVQDRHLCQHALQERLMKVGEAYAEYYNLPACRHDFFNAPFSVTEFNCEWRHCESDFSHISSSINFLHHVTDHCKFLAPTETDEGNYFQCEWVNCGKNFTKKSNMRRHLRGHANGKIIGCHGCGICFSSINKFKRHLHRQPNPDGNYHCNTCNQCFIDPKFYNEHLKKHKPSIHCPHCDYVCGDKWSLKRHTHYKHNDKRPYVCNICSKRYKSGYDLSIHRRVHDDNIYKKEKITRKYCCHICQKIYSRGYLLSAHLVSSHNFTGKKQTRNMFKLNDDDGYYYLSL